MTDAERWTDAEWAAAREMTPERLEWHRERVAKMAHAFGDHAGEDLLEHIDALQARVEAAERERDHAKTANGWDEWKRTTLEAFALIKAKRDAAEARARDAEAKLAALVEACDHDEAVFTRWLRNEPGVSDATLAEAEAALDAALKAARGEP